MSCHHRYHPHGCDWTAPPADWYDAYDYRPRRYRDDVVVLREDDLKEEEDEEWPRQRAQGRGRRRASYDRTTDEATAASLRSRTDALREELVKIEEDLKQLSAEPGPSATT